MYCGVGKLTLSLCLLVAKCLGSTRGSNRKVRKEVWMNRFLLLLTKHVGGALPPMLLRVYPARHVGNPGRDCVLG